MAKWFGKVGYEVSTEVEPGIWTEGDIVEHEYYGDTISDSRRLQSTGEVNDGISVATKISIVSDPFAYENCSHMIYAEIMGDKWKITSIDASQRPRLILTIGGVYNGEQN